KLFELVQRARVDEDPSRDVLAESTRRHLRGELDRLGTESGSQRSLDFVIARCIDVEPQLAEERQDAPARVGLPRIAEREPEGGREGERAPRSRLKAPMIVDVARSAEAIAHLRGDGDTD